MNVTIVTLRSVVFDNLLLLKQHIEKHDVLLRFLKLNGTVVRSVFVTFVYTFLSKNTVINHGELTIILCQNYYYCYDYNRYTY